MLLLVDCNILIPIPQLLLTIMVRVLQLCICGMLGHIVRVKKLLMDIKKYCSTILYSLSLFHRNIMSSIQAILNHLKV